jgi:excisionase family DNA binding protein
MSQAIAEMYDGQGNVPRALFTAEEVAEALAISKTLVRQLTLEGVLPCRRIGRLVRYAWADVEFFVGTKKDHPYI